MSYRLDSSYTFTRPTKPARFRRLGWLFLLLALLLLAGNFVFGWLSPVVNLISPLFLKASVASDRLTDGTTYQTRQSLVSAVNRLEEENNLLRARVNVLMEVERNFARLRLEHGVETFAGTPVLVRVISKPNQTPYDVLVVDTGSEQSPRLKVGQVAVVSGVVLGQVIEVGPRSAKVRLLSSARLEVPVLIGENNVQSIAKGLGGGNFSVSLPRGVSVEVGEPVVASAFSQYLLGRVNYIEHDPSQPFQEIRFRMPVNLFEVRWLELYD